jgi:hypothetical protein
MVLVPTPVPHSMRYNPIGVPSVARSGRERKCRVGKQADFSDDDDDFAPASPTLPPLSQP